MKNKLIPYLKYCLACGSQTKKVNRSILRMENIVFYRCLNDKCSLKFSREIDNHMMESYDEYNNLSCHFEKIDFYDDNNLIVVMGNKNCLSYTIIINNISPNFNKSFNNIYDALDYAKKYLNSLEFI